MWPTTMYVGYNSNAVMNISGGSSRAATAARVYVRRLLQGTAP